MIYYFKYNKNTPFNINDYLNILPNNILEDLKLKKTEFGKISKVIGYVLLLQALKDLNIKTLPILEYNQYGKPFLKNIPNLYFNISHTNDEDNLYLVLVIDNEEVGIDIELIKTRKDSLIRYCTNEIEYHSIINSNNIDEEFTRLFTKKESYLKCIGTGITKDLKNCLSNINYTFEEEIKDNLIITVCKKIDIEK